MPAKDTTLSPTARAERARQTARLAMARDVMHGAILARIWPAYIASSKNADYPYVLCVESPAGLLAWRLDAVDRALLDWLPKRLSELVAVTDRMPILLHLASEGW